MVQPSAASVPVWDRFVRVFHWTLVAAYAVAYVSEGEPEVLHTWAGYIVGALVVARIAWGFVGPRNARFADFVYRPSAVLAYLRQLALFRAPRHLGHSPAGGAMVLALLAVLALLVASGMTALAEKGRGPLVGWVAERGHDGLFQGIHEVVGNLSIVFILAHLVGVALASLAHRENLVRAMVTGRKRAPM